MLARGDHGHLLTIGWANQKTNLLPVLHRPQIVAMRAPVCGPLRIVALHSAPVHPAKTSGQNEGTDARG